MAEKPLRGLRILVAEDEYLLAEDLAPWLAGAGATVLGPVGTVEDAIRLLGAERRIDGAALDIDLWGERAFEVADVPEPWRSLSSSRPDMSTPHLRGGTIMFRVATNRSRLRL